MCMYCTMGGNQGYKRMKKQKHLRKAQNCNKPDKSHDITPNPWHQGTDFSHVFNNGFDSVMCKHTYRNYVNREFGIKFSTAEYIEFNRDRPSNSNIDISRMSKEEVDALNKYVYEDYIKKVPLDWTHHHHDKTRWRMEKNRDKDRRCDADEKMRRCS